MVRRPGLPSSISTPLGRLGRSSVPANGAAAADVSMATSACSIAPRRRIRSRISGTSSLSADASSGGLRRRNRTRSACRIRSRSSVQSRIVINAASTCPGVCCSTAPIHSRVRRSARLSCVDRSCRPSTAAPANAVATTTAMSTDRAPPATVSDKQYSSAFHTSTSVILLLHFPRSSLRTSQLFTPYFSYTVTCSPTPAVTPSRLRATLISSTRSLGLSHPGDRRINVSDRPSSFRVSGGIDA